MFVKNLTKEKVTLLTNQSLEPGQSIEVTHGVVRANGPWLVGQAKIGNLEITEIREEEYTPALVMKMRREDIDGLLEIHGLSDMDGTLHDKRRALVAGMFAEAAPDGDV